MSLTRLMEASTEIRERPASVPADLRALWRLAELVICVDSFHGKKVSLAHLHLMNGALRFPDLRGAFLSALSRRRVQVRFEPSLIRVVNLALAKNLLARTSAGDYQLSSRGLAFAKEIQATPGLLRSEREFLGQIGRLTKGRLDTMMAAEGLS